MDIYYEENGLTAEEFLAIRESVGWQGNLRQIRKALEKGLYNVTAKDGGLAVGMGRLVGDGFMYWYIQDVIIRPEYQARGIGKGITERLLRYVEKNSLPDTTVTIGLMAAKGKDGFYEKMGFIARPTKRYGAGMIKLQQIC